jgi:hypothetical protein
MIWLPTLNHISLLHFIQILQVIKNWLPLMLLILLTCERVGLHYAALAYACRLPIDRPCSSSPNRVRT